MLNKHELIDGYRELLIFITKLEEFEEDLWNTPIAEGKWTVKEVITHLMLWDNYFYAEAIKPILIQQPITMNEEVDVEEFNSKVRDYAQSKSISEISLLTEQYRKQLIEAFESIPEENYKKTYADGDGSPFIVQEVIRDMIGHDHYHLNQIKNVLK